MNPFTLFYNKIEQLYDKNQEIWLPIIDENGQPGRYVYGANWVNWTFRINGVVFNQENLSKGLIKHSSFWAGQNNKDLNNLVLSIKLKKIKSTDQFNENFLTNQIKQNEWEEYGEIKWLNKIPSIDFYSEIEKKQ